MKFDVSWNLAPRTLHLGPEPQHLHPREWGRCKLSDRYRPVQAGIQLWILVAKAGHEAVRVVTIVFYLKLDSHEV